MTSESIYGKLSSGYIADLSKTSKDLFPLLENLITKIIQIQKTNNQNSQDTKT